MMSKLKNVRAAALAALVLLHTSAFGQTGFSFGVGGEANFITLEDDGLAVGGGITTDYRFGPVFAAGIRLDAFYDRNELFSFENRLFARWYFVQPRSMAFFFQGDAGILLTLRGPLEAQNSRGAPNAGLTLGTRILLPKSWYLEPYIRGGYPYIAGAGLMVGFQPGPKKESPGEGEPQIRQGPEGNEGLENGEELVVFRPLSSVPEIAALAIEPYIYFGSNIAGFTGLDQKTVQNNYRLLQELAGFLNLNSEYNLIIEGHANPVTNTQDEEETSLNPLSIERANLVANNLLFYGVDRKRLIIAGSGGTKTLVPWHDRSNWNLNRRAEFILIRQQSRTDQ